MFKLDNFSAYQFTLFRLIFGGYLTIHFSMLVPYASELFSSGGALPNPALIPTFEIFPNLMNLMSSPLEATFFVGMLALLSCFYTLGMWRRTSALLLWYGWACLLNRNIFISNPGIPFIGWLLLASCLIPAGEPLSFNQKHRKENWEFPASLFWGSWLLLGAGYTLSGIHKLGSPSWVDGSAFVYLLENPLARVGGLSELLLALPPFVLQGMTWGILSLEILALPLFLWSRSRGLAWLGFVLMHIGIILVIDFADLSIGMLMIHLFTFDARWLPQCKTTKPSIIFFDGVCGVCNRFVNFLREEDRNGQLNFASLQGSTASEYLGDSEAKNSQSIVVFHNNKLYRKSEAMVIISKELGGIWRLAEIFCLIPRSWRDLIYDFIAQHRYQLGGKLDQCRLVAPGESNRFLP